MSLAFQDDKLILDNDALAMDQACCCGIPCEGCCVAGVSEFEEVSFIDVDFGAAALTNGSKCITPPGFFDCGDITGIIQVGQIPDCNWGEFLTVSFFCDDDEPSNQAVISVAIRTSGDNCFWEVSVETRRAGSELATGLVVYQSTPKVFVEADCDLIIAITLTKVSENWNNWCNGAMPMNITIEVGT